VADLQQRGVKPAGCIIGEPTDMQAIVAHKGKRDFCCRVRGREAHSSLTPTAVNAIEYAAQVISFIRALASKMAREEPKDGRFEVPHSTLQTGVIHAASQPTWCRATASSSSRCATSRPRRTTR